MRVFIGQFIKEERASEHKALERFVDLISVRRFGHGLCITRKPAKEDIDAALEGMKEAERGAPFGSL